MEKSTRDLEKVLGSTHPRDIGKYLKDHKKELLGDRPFYHHLKDCIKANGLMWRDVFLNADIGEKYGQKLIYGEKKARSRDVIVRLCWGGKLTLEQTQEALELYGLNKLYARNPRDAALMIMFNHRPAEISDIDNYLEENGMEKLYACHNEKSPRDGGNQ